MQDGGRLKPVRVICQNCHGPIVGWQDKEGVTRIQCPKCGAVTVSKLMSRRHVQMDIYAPAGQTILDN